MVERNPSLRAIDISRRDFLMCAASAPFWYLQTGGTHAAIVAGFVYAAEHETAARAARLSSLEAQRAAELLGREVQFVFLRDVSFTKADAAWSSVIVATRRKLLLPASTLRLDIANRPSCGTGNTLYLRPATKDAVWHASLKRFGAEQLNDRFRAARIPINDQTWLGWFAVKCAWEAAVRDQSVRHLAFDGHKGRALRFNAAGILVQPLYELTSNERGVAREIDPNARPEAFACAS